MSFFSLFLEEKYYWELEEEEEDPEEDEEIKRRRRRHTSEQRTAARNRRRATRRHTAEPSCRATPHSALSCRAMPNHAPRRGVPAEPSRPSRAAAPHRAALSRRAAPLCRAVPRRRAAALPSQSAAAAVRRAAPRRAKPRRTGKPASQAKPSRAKPSRAAEPSRAVAPPRCRAELPSMPTTTTTQTKPLKHVPRRQTQVPFRGVVHARRQQAPGWAVGAGTAAGDESTTAPGRRQMRVSVRVCEITHSISWLDVRISNRPSHFVYVTVEHMAIICVRVRMLLESRAPTHTKKSAPLLPVSDVPEQTSRLLTPSTLELVHR